MKAAILEQPGKLGIRKVRTPECPCGGVLVEVKACGICSSDAKMVTSGHRALNYPRILGHEIAGIVSESQNPQFKPGDRVQVAPGLRCGECLACRRGMDNQCEHREILGFSYDGGFARIPLSGPIIGALTLLPENVSFEDAALGEPLACCINAQERAGVRSHDTVLIIGAGPLGLLHALVAKSRRVQTVIISETLEDSDKFTGPLRPDIDFQQYPPPNLSTTIRFQYHPLQGNCYLRSIWMHGPTK